jgi:hypothetical protein
LAALCACSFIVNSDSTQCSSTADCIAKGAAFAGMVCSPQGVCQAQGGCTTNAQCIDANKGEPWICKKSTRTCVNLVKTADDYPGSPRCQPYADKDDIRNDEIVWIGNMAPPENGGYPTQEHLPEVARQQFKSQIGALPGVGPGAPGRPLGVEFCDTFGATDHQAAVNGAKFLVEDVGVQLLWGPSGDHLPAVYQPILKPAQTLTISIAAGEQADIDTQNPHFVYTFFAKTTDGYARTANTILAAAEPVIREEAHMAPSDKLRMAILIRNNPQTQDYLRLTLKYLTLNGRPGTDVGQDELQIISYSDSAPPAELTAAVSKIVSFQPHYVWAISQDEFLHGLMTPIEDQLPANSVRPIWYILPSSLSTDFLGVVNLEQYRKLRVAERVTFIAADWVKQDPAIPTIDPIYHALFPNDPQVADQHLLGFQYLYYNLFYYSAYLIAANGASPLTGPNLVKAMPRIQDPNGVPINAGPEELYNGLSALQTGRTLNFSVIGFDQATGLPQIPATKLYCFNVNASGFAAGFRPSSPIDYNNGWAVDGPFDCIKGVGTDADAGVDGGQ